ncbi:Crp/Fnr family transcriptional regulator [Tepidamorphus sp. 3E244]|uniref:Crp/Fnr family transcriptional regulator n=1 Tax=Tepidamorphus sp. 3E244 TaxID=3385498 RepID=UPI0038FC532A
MLQKLDVSLIRDLPPFRDLDENALGELLMHARSHRISKDANIFSQGQSAQEFFLLLDGHLRVVKLTPQGEQFVPRYISAGELFGIAVALGLDEYPATAVAARDCVVLSWPNSLWSNLIQRHPTFATNTYAMVGQRLSETQQQLAALATECVEQRVAHAILKLANQTGRKTEDGIVIDFPVTREDISDMTGTTLHTVSRLLSAWETAGWVKSGRKQITLTDGHRLVMIASGKK